MKFKYVHKMVAPCTTDLLTIGCTYTGNYEGTGSGRRVRLDQFPSNLFYPQRFRVVEGATDISEPNTAGGMKYDGDKPRMDLLLTGCPNALEAVSSILTFGAKKYAAHSWQTVPQGDERYLAALLRHLTAVGKGETLDSESGMLHLAHAACNALFILELELRKASDGNKEKAN